MTWVKMDDQFADHPKVAEIGAKGIATYIRGLCYASRYLTDGFLSEAVVALLLAPEIADEEIHQTYRTQDQSGVHLPERLVEADLWHRAKGGYVIHDYLVYNPSRSQVLSQRKRDRLRKGRMESDGLPAGIPPESNVSRTPTPTPKTKKEKTPPPLSSSTPSGPAAWGTVEALIELYNSATPDECPEVEQVSPGRREKARRYLKDFPDRAFWETVFREVHGSRFLRGLVKREGHAHFVADFDWLLTKGKDGTENVVKAFEGRYKD